MMSVRLGRMVGQLAIAATLAGCGAQNNPPRVAPPSYAVDLGKRYDVVYYRPPSFPMQATMRVEVAPEMIEHHVTAMAEQFGQAVSDRLPAAAAQDGDSLRIGIARNAEDLAARTRGRTADMSRYVLVLSPSRADTICRRLYFQNRCDLELAMQAVVYDRDAKRTPWRFNQTIKGSTTGGYDLDVDAYWRQLRAAMVQAGLTAPAPTKG